MGFKSGPLSLMIGYVATWVRLGEFPRPTDGSVERKGARRRHPAAHLQRLAERSGERGKGEVGAIMGLGYLARIPGSSCLQRGQRLPGRDAPQALGSQPTIAICRHARFDFAV